LKKIELSDTYCVEFKRCTEEELITLIKFDDNTHLDHHCDKKNYTNYDDLEKFYDKVQNDKFFDDKKYSSEFASLLEEEFKKRNDSEEEEEEDDDNEDEDDKEGNN
jgi:hypothetical protein